MIKSFSIPVPSSVGVGAWVDVREVGPVRALVYTSSNTDTVVLEGSANGVDGAEIAGAFFTSSAAKELNNACTHVRARRKTGGGGTQTLHLSAAPLDSAEDHAVFTKGPDAAANETLARIVFFRSNGKRQIRDFSVTFQSSVTGSGANYGTSVVEAIKADGTVKGTVAAVATTANATALIPVDGVAGAVTELDDGELLTYAQAKTGTGVQLPLYTGVIRFR